MDLAALLSEPDAQSEQEPTKPLVSVGEICLQVAESDSNAGLVAKNTNDELVETVISTEDSSEQANRIISASSQSLTSSVMEFPEENGRTYHGYRAGTYYFPNDGNEQDRLESQFDMLKCALSDRNYLAPINNPRCILDVRTGQWAIQMGDTFPNAEVQATDLSPIQPLTVPENVHFYIDDASDDDWVLPSNHFDYIHTRVLLGCFEDFSSIIKKAFYHTKPGAYMESQEIMFTPYCDDETMPDDWPFLEWVKYVTDAAAQAGRSLNIASDLKKWYEEAGFVDVQERVFKLPVNPWSEDKHLKALGEMSEENWLDSLSSFSLALFSRILDWKQDEIEVYLIDIRKAIPDRSIHAYHKVFVVWGRKPDEIEKEASGSPKEDPDVREPADA